jgi:hypothetical protein
LKEHNVFNYNDTGTAVSSLNLPSSSLSLGSIAPLSFSPISTGPSSPSLVDNFFGTAEAFAGHPGHGLLQGKPRTKTTIYHPAAHMTTSHMGGSLGMGMGMGMNAIPSSVSLPYPKEIGQLGKKGR